MLHKCSPVVTMFENESGPCVLCVLCTSMACVLCVCPSTFAAAVEGRFVACTKAIFPLTLAANASGPVHSFWQLQSQLRRPAMLVNQKSADVEEGPRGFLRRLKTFPARSRYKVVQGWRDEATEATLGSQLCSAAKSFTAEPVILLSSQSLLPDVELPSEFILHGIRFF